MFDPVRIKLLGKPVPKGRGRAHALPGGRNVVFTPTSTRTYEAALQHAATQAMGERMPIDEPVKLKLLAIVPIPTSWSGKKQAAAAAGTIFPGGRPDLDNIVKACLDGMNRIVFRDDDRVVHIEARKIYGEQPGVWIVVESATPMTKPFKPASASPATVAPVQDSLPLTQRKPTPEECLGA